MVAGVACVSLFSLIAVGKGVGDCCPDDFVKFVQFAVKQQIKGIAKSLMFRRIS
jgi:hypothetical protein